MNHCKLHMTCLGGNNMYIKSYSCKRFAGIKDKDISFEKGLNVILGPNESGKSTIIDGIHSTLFKSIKLKRNNNPDIIFTSRYMPKPNGDSIDGSIIISIKDEDYILHKEWGIDSKIQLTTPDQELIKNEESIQNALNELLVFGEGTYTNIVFAKQRELKAAIANLVGNSEVTNEINSLLRNTIMELDGVSLDDLQQKIENELINLTKRWDIEKGYPENNRGINNPYKTGFGKILESFYRKEELKLEMDLANRSETKFEEVCSLIKNNDIKISEFKLRKDQLEKIEGDVNSRSLIESELKFIEKELEELSNVNKEWPRSSLLLEQYNKQSQIIIDKNQRFMMEINNYKLFKEKNELKIKLNKVTEINNKIQEIKSEIKNIPHISKEDIINLTSLEKECLTVETAMSAGVMIGNMTIFNLNGDVYISKDLDEKKLLEKNVEFRANGFVNIEYEDKFQLQIKTGELNFEELKQRYNTLNDEISRLLISLKIKTLEEGKLNKEKIDKLTLEIQAFNSEINIYLGECTLEQLIINIDKIENIPDSRDLADIELDIKNLANEELQLGIDKQTLENKIILWLEKYTDEDNLLDMLLEQRGALKNTNKVLEELAPLPKEFLEVSDFKDTLNEIKVSYESYRELQSSLNLDYYEAQKQLLDNSYEELKVQYENTKIEFNKNLDRGNNLIKIKKVFLETKEDLGKDPMDSLIKEFSRVLSIITNGSYHLGKINENFEISLESKIRGTMDIDLLSAGTYDAVTLALRFSILKHIYGDKNGYVCLDDCLVDLDPVRKIQSVNIIKDFATHNQVIFTTCDPTTATQLGGNIINI